LHRAKALVCTTHLPSMNNNLIVLTLFVLFLVGVFSVYPEIVFGKHEEKQKSDNNDKSENHLSNEPKTDSTGDSTTSSTDVIPIEPPTATTTTTATCDSTEPECVAATNNLIKEQTELEKQRMLIAQQQQEQNEMALENQRVIDNINAAQSQDTGSSDIAALPVLVGEEEAVYQAIMKSLLLTNKKIFLQEMMIKV
jgi:hypothetical protein